MNRKPAVARIRRRINAAFSLIEIMVVVVIIGILAAGVMTQFRGAPDEAKLSRAKSDMAGLKTALEVFRLHVGRFPTTDEGLQALVVQPEEDEQSNWKGPYLDNKSVPADPWGNEYQYISPGEMNEDSYDLFSYGADGEEGGEGEYDRDITNWTDETEDADTVQI